MRTTLKIKITLGVVFLFALLLLLGGTGFFFLNKTLTEQKVILQDNYESLEYTRNMLQALDSSGALPFFETNLVAQESNITEPGEEKVTRFLREHFNNYKTQTDSRELQALIRQDINRIMEINLSAIINKNKITGKNAEDALFMITLLLTVCALLGFTFVYNFPGYIANPVIRLTNGIKAVAGKNYEQRIHLDRNDEFGEMAAAFNHMAEALDKYEHSNLAKILFEKQRAETVINSLKDASIGIDKNNRILFANPLALRLLNLSEAEVVGEKIPVLQKRNDLFRFLFDDNSNQPFKIVLDNHELFFNKETVDISNAEGSMGSMIVLKNITPYKELDVAKTNFIATVSHELKTPLASSDFSLKLLEDERVGSLNAEQKKLVQHLKEDNQRLLRILSELLDFSQVESGKIQLSVSQVDAMQLIQRSIAAVDQVTEQKKITIKTTVDEALPPVLADAEKSTWVLINFLTNAIKYSAENSVIEVHAKLENKEVLFEVTDHGNGIAPDHIARIFDRYYQVPGTSKTGTGLGLSICKEFIEAMHGHVGVRSEPGKGSSFYFSLPALPSVGNE